MCWTGYEPTVYKLVHSGIRLASAVIFQFAGDSGFTMFKTEGTEFRVVYTVHTQISEQSKTQQLFMEGDMQTIGFVLIKP